uniref:Uncharacterized protein n=1 Tax=Spironucleus salmonicida TaxID=348837 RepID=V6LMP9_9EUKA|eukprot:EST45493.1 Hypothetical protein SS50377_14565 [Spironucleus salmonicida]
MARSTSAGPEHLSWLVPQGCSGAPQLAGTTGLFRSTSAGPEHHSWLVPQGCSGAPQLAGTTGLVLSTSAGWESMVRSRTTILCPEYDQIHCRWTRLSGSVALMQARGIQRRICRMELQNEIIYFGKPNGAQNIAKCSCYTHRTKLEQKQYALTYQ